MTVQQIESVDVESFKAIAEDQAKSAASLMMAVSRIRERLRQCVERKLQLEGAVE